MMRPILDLLAIGFVLILLGGCAKDPIEIAPLLPPTEHFQEAERRLLAAETLDFEFTIVSQGAFEANLEGVFKSESPDKVSIRAEGFFAGKPVVLTLDADGQTMKGGNGTDNFEAPQPAALREAVLLGLTRMGLLHNLARLNMGQPPDRAEGGIDEWVKARYILDTDLTQGRREFRVLNVSLYITDQHVADAVFATDTVKLLPAYRRQTVYFEEKKMTVSEDYEHTQK
jgi:hypothetical protein